MENKCNHCSCNKEPLISPHNCVTSYPECVEQNPCSEIFSDLCILHTPNPFVILLPNNNQMTISNNIPIYNVLQHIGMYLDTNLSQYSLDSNQYGPILGLRTVWIGQTSFKVRWDYPKYIPPYQSVPTKFVVTVSEIGNLSNNGTFTLTNNVNSVIVQSHLSLTIDSEKQYYVNVKLINENTSAILTSSISIIVKTK